MKDSPALHFDVPTYENRESESVENPRSPDRRPENIRELTIKNLDTGEEFVIGENDPDFEFDTFEITCRPLAETEADAENDDNDNDNEIENGENDINKKLSSPEENNDAKEPASPEDKVSTKFSILCIYDMKNFLSQVEMARKNAERISWMQVLYRYLFKGKGEAPPLSNDQDPYQQSASGDAAATSSQDLSSTKSKTPFTKLSSFKFKKELGRGAFGRYLTFPLQIKFVLIERIVARVMLAEAKTDGKLYALKIISKANMRTSDKRQVNLV